MFSVYYLVLVLITPSLFHPLSFFPQTRWPSLVFAMDKPSDPTKGPDRDLWLVQSVHTLLGQIARDGDKKGHMLFPVDEAMVYGGSDLDYPIIYQMWRRNNDEIVPEVTLLMNETKEYVPDHVGSNEYVVQIVTHLGTTTLTNDAIWQGPVKIQKRDDTPPKFKPTLEYAAASFRMASESSETARAASLAYIYKSLEMSFPGDAEAGKKAMQLYKNAAVMTGNYDAFMQADAKVEKVKLERAIETKVIMKTGKEDPEIARKALSVGQEGVMEYAEKEEVPKDLKPVGPEGDKTKSWYANSIDEKNAFKRGGLPKMTKSPKAREFALKLQGAKDGAIKHVRSMARSGGKLLTKLALSMKFAAALAVVGAAVGIAFVVVHFQNGEVLAGALGIVSTALGVVALLLFAVGAVTGGIATAIAIILAVIFEEITKKPMAKVTDPLGILRRQFFGDLTITGNEKCREGSKDKKEDDPNYWAPSPDCEMVYSAGWLQHMFAKSLTNYQTTVLSVWVNMGLPVTLEDLSKKLCVMDKDERFDKDMCKDAPFRVHCNNKRATPGRVPIPGTGFDKCSDPSFDVQLHLIKLPAIDKNADEVEKLIMGAPNAVKEANCKLVQFDGTQEFADYGIGLDGMPAGIACGLTPDSKLPGGQEWTGVSDGNQATNGLNQPVDGPEKAMDFKVLGDKYFCLFKGDGPGDKVCLPPFKMNSQGDKSFQFSKVNRLGIPQEGNWKAVAHWESRDLSSRPITTNRITLEYTKDTPKDKLKNIDMAFRGMKTNTFNAASFHIHGPDPDEPVVCLFDKGGHDGNVLCLGEGAQDLPKEWQKSAASAKLWGARLTVYDDHIDKKPWATGQWTNGDADFDNLKYGTNENYVNRAVSVWIQRAI